MNRRHILLAGPALVAASAVPAAADSACLASPVARLFQQWKEYSAWLEQPEAQGLPEDEFNAAVDVRTDLENRMIAMPPRDASDVLMMIAAYADFGIGEVPCAHHLPELWAKVRAVLEEGGAA